MKRVYIPAVKTSTYRPYWRFLWVIPFTFYLITEYYSNTYIEGFATMELTARTNAIAMLVILSLGSWVIYYVTSILLLLQTRSDTYQLQNQSLVYQYSHMSDRIDETRRVRHDLRHHLVLIQHYLEDKKYEDLQSYLNRYAHSLPFEETLTYCDHYTINALLAYYGQRAKDDGITWNVKVFYPANLPFSAEDLTIVFSNLLENALDAYREISEDGRARTIDVQGRFRNDMLIFQVTNHTLHTAFPDENGLLPSTKHSGKGIGLESVRTIAQKYHGNVSITSIDQTFCVKVTLLI